LDKMVVTTPLALNGLKSQQLHRINKSAMEEHKHPAIDRIQGRAQLMGDDRKEFVFQSIRSLRLLACCLLAHEQVFAFSFRLFALDSEGNSLRNVFHQRLLSCTWRPRLGGIETEAS